MVTLMKMALCRQARQSLLLFYKKGWPCTCQRPSREISFFKRKSKDEELDPEMELPDTIADKRKHRVGRDEITMAETLNQLHTSGRLTTKKEYKPPSDVEERIKNITMECMDVPGGTDWDQVSIKDPKLKYKLLTKCMKEFDHRIPNTEVTKMEQVKDAVQFFQSEVRTSHSLEDLSKLDLPKNLHIQLEYLRFDPETDTMFDGKTAFPGRDTVVPSIKYKRKYKNIKTTVEKPGYVNHYYGY